jgi:hypothetical protein
MQIVKSLAFTTFAIPIQVLPIQVPASQATSRKEKNVLQMKVALMTPQNTVPATSCVKKRSSLEEIVQQMFSV